MSLNTGINFQMFYLNHVGYKGRNGDRNYHESLTGRKRIFELSTITFKEFVNFKTNYKYEDRLLEFFEVEKDKVLDFLREYLNFGGYPRVVLAETFSEKQRTISEIYQSYVEKDISYLLGLRKTEEFSNLVRILADQIGNTVNFSELSSTVGISAKTIKDYIWCLEKTFVLERVTPFFKNIRKEITKSPIFYFNDIGLRNYSTGVFGRFEDKGKPGFLFQNFVFHLLKEKIALGPAKLHFWRTKDGAEVDFVLDSKEQSPIEVKYQLLKEVEISRSFRSFIDKYEPREALVINLALEKTAVINKTSVKFIPFFKLIKY